MVGGTNAAEGKVFQLHRKLSEIAVNYRRGSVSIKDGTPVKPALVKPETPQPSSRLAKVGRQEGRQAGGQGDRETGRRPHIQSHAQMEAATCFLHRRLPSLVCFRLAEYSKFLRVIIDVELRETRYLSVILSHFSFSCKCKCKETQMKQVGSVHFYLNHQSLLT